VALKFEFGVGALGDEAEVFRGAGSVDGFGGGGALTSGKGEEGEEREKDCDLGRVHGVSLGKVV